ncbi:MAG: hypothetical protein WAL95_11375 [Candidatus Acidiferrales bacterium]
MRVLNAAEVDESFRFYEKLGDEYVHYDEERTPFFTHSEAASIDVEYPPKLERLPFFARYLSTIGYDDWDFQGALIWFTEWGVWNLSDEGVGYRIVERMHVAAGQSASFEVAPGHEFRADELTDAVGMLMQPMIFGWDAFYLPRWSYGTGQFFLHVSHDSFVNIVTRTKEFNDRVFQQLQELELHPKATSDSRAKRFCRRP